VKPSVWFAACAGRCSISIAAAGLQKCEGNPLRKIFRCRKEEKQEVAENCAGKIFVIFTLSVMTICGNKAGWEFVRKGYKYLSET